MSVFVETVVESRILTLVVKVFGRARREPSKRARRREAGEPRLASREMAPRGARVVRGASRSDR